MMTEENIYINEDKRESRLVLVLYFALVALAVVAIGMFHVGRYTMKTDIRARITAAAPKPTQLIKIPELEITLVPFGKGFIVDKKANVVIAGDLR